MKRRKIDTEIGGVAAVNAMFVARHILAPSLHARPRLIRELLAEECIEPLERRKGIFLKGREMYVEKTMIPSGITIGDESTQAELGPFGVLPSEVMLIDAIRIRL